MFNYFKQNRLIIAYALLILIVITTFIEGVLDIMSLISNSLVFFDFIILPLIITILALSIAYLIYLEISHLNSKALVSSRQINERLEIEQALRISEEQYKDIVENTYNIFYKTDRNLIITYVNKAVQEHLGYPPEIFIGTNVFQWVHIDEREEKQQAYSKLPIAPKDFNYRLQLPNKVFYISAHRRPIFDHKGNFDGWIVIASNVTNEYIIQKQLRASEERYRSLYQNAQVGLCTSSIDGSITIMANAKVAEMFGYDSESEIIDKPSINLWADKNERDTLVHLLEKNNSVIQYPFNGMCNDGTIKNFELFARYNPELKVIESNIIDVTDRKLAEEKIKYQAYLLENIQESIIVLDENGCFTYINQQAEKIFGFPINKLYGRKISEFNLPYNLDRLKQIKSKVLQEETWYDEQPHIINGEERIFMHRVNSLKEETYNTGIVIISTDITELVEIRRSAESANMAKSQFLANMSHEIRTPMIGILGSVDLLEQSELSEENKENLKVIRDCGGQLLQIINEILDVSKIEVGLVELYPEPVEVAEVLNKCISVVEPMLRDKGLKLEFTIDEISTRIYADQIKLRQIIVNILYNAVKFTHKGYISIDSRLININSQNYLTISIADTGIGIQDKKIDKIYDPFTQGDNSTVREYGGTGLGLYICKKLIDLMGGKISVRSQVNVGTVFNLEIPVELVEDSQLYDNSYNDYTIIDEDDLYEGFIPISILVVEDNQLNQKIVCQSLLNFGFDVTTVNNGLECISILKRRTFDIILMDMQMPLMDGYEATQILKANEKTEHIPIIAITANAMNGDKEKCLASGCNAYIAKPFKTEQLIKEIKTLLKPNQRKRHNYITNQLIADLIPEFMEIMKDMITDLEDAATCNDIDKIKSISHDIKGTAGMYGYTSLSEIAAFIEYEAKAHNTVKISKLVSKLYSTFTQIDSQVS